MIQNIHVIDSERVKNIIFYIFFYPEFDVDLRKRPQGRVFCPSGKIEHLLKHQCYTYKGKINQFGTSADTLVIFKC